MRLNAVSPFASLRPMRFTRPSWSHGRRSSQAAADTRAASGLRPARVRCKGSARPRTRATRLVQPRTRAPSAEKSPSSPTHVSRAHPELVRRYGSSSGSIPAILAVRRQTMNVVLDVVRRYDIDGVHIDDYLPVS